MADSPGFNGRAKVGDENATMLAMASEMGRIVIAFMRELLLMGIQGAAAFTLTI